MAVAGGHLAGQAMTYTPGGGGGLGQAAAMVGVRAMTLPAMVGGGGSAAAAAANIPGPSLTYEEVCCSGNGDMHPDWGLAGE